MAASFRTQVIIPVLPLWAQALYIHIHILQHLHHVLAGVLTCLIVIKTEVHHIQLWILPQALQHRLDGRTTAGQQHR